MYSYPNQPTRRISLTQIFCLLCLITLAACTTPLTQTPASGNSSAVSAGLSTRTPLPTIQVTTIPTRSVSGMPSLASLPEGWNQIDPGGETRCAYGGKYSFFVRKTTSQKLMIYFEGGGSCYDAKTCRVGGVHFDDSIDITVDGDNPALKSYGIFALGDPNNPFRDYNIVFVSYCTGDAHLGTKTVQYNDEGYVYPINHVGFINSQTVLAWTYQNFPKPERVFEIGCSAGVAGSFFHAPYILQHYTGVPFTLVGDSGGGFLDGSSKYLLDIGASDVLPNWLPEYQNLLSTEKLPSKRIFSAPALAAPQAHFAMVDTQDDGIQIGIMRKVGYFGSLARLLETNMQAITNDAPDNFAYYIAPGDHHCITMAPQYYTTVVDGINLNDWFTSLEAGQAVQSVAP